jgi:hypothetical protein
MLAETTAPTKTKKSLKRSVARSYWPQNKVSGSSWSYDTAVSPWKPTRKDRPTTVYLLKSDKSLAKDMALESSFVDWINEKSRLIWTEEKNEDELVNIKEALASAKVSLLGLQQDWDGEGSPGYSEETCDRMSKFLLNHSKQLAAAYGVKTPIPKILPGPNGSIDLLWKSDDYELLLNIPADSQSPASFYGDDKGNLCIKGKLAPDKINQGILQWLMSHQTP